MTLVTLSSALDSGVESSWNCTFLASSSIYSTVECGSWQLSCCFTNEEHWRKARESKQNFGIQSRVLQCIKCRFLQFDTKSYCILCEPIDYWLVGVYSWVFCSRIEQCKNSQKSQENEQKNFWMYKESNADSFSLTLMS